MSLLGYVIVKKQTIDRLKETVKMLKADLAQEREMNIPCYVVQKTDEAKAEIEKLKAEVEACKKKYLDELQLRLELAKMVDETQGGRAV